MLCGTVTPPDRRASAHIRVRLGLVWQMHARSTRSLHPSRPGCCLQPAVVESAAVPVIRARMNVYHSSWRPSPASIEQPPQHAATGSTPPLPVPARRGAGEFMHGPAGGATRALAGAAAVSRYCPLAAAGRAAPGPGASTGKPPVASESACRSLSEGRGPLLVDPPLVAVLK